VSARIDLIEQFVIRIYDQVLGRRAEDDGDGLRDWTNFLKSGGAGVNLARGFFFSDEFIRRNHSNERFVEILYQAILGRPADAEGKASWMSVLNAGLPREDVFAGFIHSNEFTRLCAIYGIERGTFVAPPGGMARVFATRLYLETLERRPDEVGLNEWTEALMGGRHGAQVAYGFIFSDEMYRRNLTDEQFIEVLYRALMGRDSDDVGLADWLAFLRNGGTRFGAFVGFVNAPEFERICQAHGIVRGHPPAQGGR
jgi:hypothetical protein